MDIFLGGVLFALFIVAQALALIALRPLSIEKSRQPTAQPDDGRPAADTRSVRIGPDGVLNARGRRMLQP
jgi:hypothetical protein